MSTALVGFPQSDPVRFGAAISTSVGFLGAGAMHQGRTYKKGMTTAAGIWLAAALGIAAAAGMFLVAFTGSIATVLISRYLRFDSSLHLIRHDEDPMHDESDDFSADVAPVRTASPPGVPSTKEKHSSGNESQASTSFESNGVGHGGERYRAAWDDKNGLQVQTSSDDVRD
jgi:uncharacterized membrane protein YhiD involved in acid resistance